MPRKQSQTAKLRAQVHELEERLEYTKQTVSMQRQGFQEKETDRQQKEIGFLRQLAMNLTERGSPIRQTIATVNYSGQARVEKAATEESYGTVNQLRPTVNQERDR